MRFPVQANQQSPVDFIADMGWGAVKSLSAMDEYRNLDRDIENNQKRWRKFVEADAPEKEKFPQVRSSYFKMSNFDTTEYNKNNRRKYLKTKSTRGVSAIRMWNSSSLN